VKITFLLLKPGNEILDECNALLRFRRVTHEKFVMPVFLELRGFLAKRSTDALTELQLCPGSSRIEIGEAFSAKVFHLREKFLKVSDTTSEFFYRGGFDPQAGLV
jgi:hypothetical protein